MRYKKTSTPGSSFFDENNSENLNLPAQSLNYEEISRTILTPKCLSCHSNSGGNRGRVNLETYANVFSLKDRIKASVISQEMPIGDSLNQEELNSLVTWIDNGALETPIRDTLSNDQIDAVLSWIDSGALNN